MYKIKPGLVTSTYTCKGHIAKFLTWNICDDCHIKKESKIYKGNFIGVEAESFAGTT